MSARRLRSAAALLVLALPVPAQLADDPVAAPAPRALMTQPDGAALPAYQALAAALTSLDEAMIQQLDGALWSEVRASVKSGRDSLHDAITAGAPRELCLAVDTTLTMLGERQAHIEAVAFGSEGELTDAPLERIARRLALVEGRIPQTTLLRVETLFELERDADAQQGIAHGLVIWPVEARLHEQALAWVDVLPTPLALAEQLEARVSVLGSADSDGGGIALETAALLYEEVGRRAYDDGSPDQAASLFERSVATLGRSRSLPRSLSAEEVAVLRSNASVSASYAWQQHAKNRWYEHGPDDGSADQGNAGDTPSAGQELSAAKAAAFAEENLVQALEIDPNNEEALQRAALYLGDMLMTRGGPDVHVPRQQDIGDMRDFYGRIAKRFDVATWWNNYAFWCRETGTASEEAGDLEAARRLYEQSYEGYSNAIRLEPDNSRYVNDTGLMLLYHLGRDLDEAEQLFLRSWELGRAVCENPFVEQSVYDENLSAYGDAMLNLARLYQMQGKLERAAEIAAELLELAPERFDARMTQREIETALAAREG